MHTEWLYIVWNEYFNVQSGIQVFKFSLNIQIIATHTTVHLGHPPPFWTSYLYKSSSEKFKCEAERHFNDYCVDVLEDETTF